MSSLGLPSINLLSMVITCILLWMLLFGHEELSFMKIFWTKVGERLSSSFGLSSKTPLGAFLGPIVFTVIFTLLFTGILPYGTMYLTSLPLVLFLSYGFWFTTFLYVVSSRRFVTIVFHREHGLFMACFLLPIEILGILMRPISLAVRLYANLMFGHLLLGFTFVHFACPCYAPIAFLIMGPLVCFELAVYLVQSYIFTYLVILYLAE